VPGSAARGGRSTNASLPAENDRLEIRRDPLKGRGVFARLPIPKGTVIDAAPIVVVPQEQRTLLDKTILHDYYFQWDDGPEDTGRGAVALGLVSLCNHSPRPNARAQRNPARQTLDLVALAPIAAGEEIIIDYKCTLWFEPRE
jgi:SET domain-containing protein